MVGGNLTKAEFGARAVAPVTDRGDCIVLSQRIRSKIA